ncbi:hypothetical protein TrVE_jg1141 [Triparma verrucosa]|uniref:Helicase ATP-binding domain-containing protein n=1 Tax=Triparma verrucosa TaxID=1606542 RepID=A0A9W7FL89_9STRA|nr:hypothetical protein TrVE_jg1141 [Triparma verrucosa]
MSAISLPTQPPAQPSNGAVANATVPPTPPASDPAQGVPGEEVSDTDSFNLRTYDRHWVKPDSLQHFVQWIKIPNPNYVPNGNQPRYIKWAKKLSDVPLILRDMGPPDGSIFDPKKTWEAEKPLYEAKKEAEEKALAGEFDVEEVAEVVAEVTVGKAKTAKEKAEDKKERKARQDAKKAEKNSKAGKLSKAEMIAKNDKKKENSVHKADIERMKNNNTIDLLLDAKVSTVTGQLQRMLKMLSIAVSAKERGKSGSSEEEVLDILWALEEMEVFRAADEEIARDKDLRKALKKKLKEAEKEGKDGKKDKDKKKDKKKKKGEEVEDEVPPLSPNAEILKAFYDDESLRYKDALKSARKLMEEHQKKNDIVKFQMNKMHDRLPPLSRYNRKFKLEPWQCDVLAAIDKDQSTIVCAPTSSGKTLLSTYTCAKERMNSKGKRGTVLFVLPSEVLVWQIAATYAKFFKGNVTVCTDSITFQEIGSEHRAQIYVGTPKALELALTKARGCAGQEMMANSQRESIVLDGGFDFQYMVLDEVHTLNGPEGDSLQRIIRFTRCPILALSATIGNAVQLRDWFQEVRNQHICVVEGTAVDPESQNEVLLKEHFARFINLQRYVVKEQTSVIDGKASTSYKMVKLHPVAAMTVERLQGNRDLVSSLSMTPVDMMDLWSALVKIFPEETEGEYKDDAPDSFFTILAAKTEEAKALASYEKYNQMRPGTATVDQLVGHDVETWARGVEYVRAQEKFALSNYEKFNKLQAGTATLAQLVESPEGIGGWVFGPAADEDDEKKKDKKDKDKKKDKKDKKKDKKKDDPLKKRITLPMTKTFENRLKDILATLAESQPEKYEQLRSIFDPPPLEKIDSIDITDQLYGVVSELKDKKLLPAVAFQLSTFGAFQMFKTLLKSLELAQNEKYPNHRKELREKAAIAEAFKRQAEGKAASGHGDNEKEKTEEAKDGHADDGPQTEDIFQPHPDFVLSPPGKGRLNAKEIDDVREAMKKAGEALDVNHALIRGLRRGIAIYTNEVGFACYRRQVQTLAQQGKIAVVFSDEALAYGVNMPFRSCVFCGDMGSALTPLIAQQMQGRAGRRGMDVQGNIVYLGMEWDVIENLMLGQISQVTGNNPHYPLLALQRALAMSNDPNDPNFVHGKDVDLADLDTQERANAKKWAKMSEAFENGVRKSATWQNRIPTVDEAGMEQVSGPSLANFCGVETTPNYFQVSREIIRQLEYVDFDMQLTVDHNVASMVWELGINFIAEAVNIAYCLETLYQKFVNNNRRSHKNEGDQNAFMACLLQIVDRVPCSEGDVSLQRYLKVEVEEGTGKLVDESSKDVFVDMHADMCMFRDKVNAFSLPAGAEDEKQRLILPNLGGDPEVGIGLDAGVYELLQTKRKEFPDSVPTARRNELKTRVYKFGCILRCMNNNIQQPHGKYKELSEYTNKCFSAVGYSLKDMMNQLQDQDDLVLG